METKLLLNDSEGFEWPKDSIFYALGSDGLYLGRNNKFYKSLIKTKGGPGELEPLKASLRPRFPKIPQEMFERVAGFFADVGELHDAESQCLFYWNPTDEKVEVVVPEQKTTKKSYSVKYEQPIDLPHEWLLFGDAHSHVHLSAYCSGTDIADEEHFPGLHFVFGHMDQDTIQLHCEAVVDGSRFTIDLDHVVEGFEGFLFDYPKEWMERVEVIEYSYHSVYDGKKYGGGGFSDHYGGDFGFGGSIPPLDIDPPNYKHEWRTPESQGCPPWPMGKYDSPEWKKMKRLRDAWMERNDPNTEYKKEREEYSEKRRAAYAAALKKQHQDEINDARTAATDSDADASMGFSQAYEDMLQEDALIGDSIDVDVKAEWEALADAFDGDDQPLTEQDDDLDMDLPEDIMKERELALNNLAEDKRYLAELDKKLKKAKAKKKKAKAKIRKKQIRKVAPSDKEKKKKNTSSKREITRWGTGSK